MQFGSLRPDATVLREQPEQAPYSSTVPRRRSESTRIDALLARVLAWRKALLRRIAEWRQRAAGRLELTRLTDRDLRDIGIGRSEAEAEADKPFWKS
jgi:uncharacterized protein YjiS (DUF1127 family)